MEDRRRFIGGVASAVLLALSGLGVARAQGFPSKPIKFVVPFSAGGSTDLLARVIAQKLGERLGVPIIVENRGGAGGMIGTLSVAKSAPDGYTLLIGVTSALLFGPLISKESPYDPVKDFTAISLLVHHPTILVVYPSVKATSVRELIALAKASPGSLNYGSQGSGSTAHFMGERFNKMAGVDIVHVPYKGAAPAMTDLLAGRVQMMFDSASTSMPHLKAGRLRAIGVASLKRFAALPELPTIAESGLPGFEGASWNGLVGPAGMPKEFVDRLSTEVEQVLSEPALRERLREDGMEPVGNDAATFANFIKTELQVWEPIVRAAGLYHTS